MVVEFEVVVDNVVITPSITYLKDPKTDTADEKDDATLDSILQLILIDSLDSIMLVHVMNCKDAKHIWETIEWINEGTEEVRENKLKILTSQYEHFRSNPGEGITEVFQRYNKLINDLNINGKHYTIKEINKKFLLTLPPHLELRITAIREARDLNLTGKTLWSQIPQQQVQPETRIVLPSNSVQDVIVAEHGVTSTNQFNGDFYSMEELEQLKNESMALIVKKFGHFTTKCRKPKQGKKNSYDSNQKDKSRRAYLAKGKSWDDSDSEEEEVSNLALMAIGDSNASPNKEVTFTDAEMVHHLSSTLDCAHRENDRIILQNDALQKEVNKLRLVHINQDELKEEVSFLENRVNCYKELETIFKDKITSLEIKVRELSINTPDLISAEERGIPHVLKDVSKPMFRKPITEPFDETSIIIQEELCFEDIANESVASNKCVSKDKAKVVQTTKVNLKTHDVGQKSNMPNMHNMPTINLFHKAYIVANCMSCPFNVTFVYFNAKYTSNDKTPLRQHVNNKKHDRPKAVSPPKVRKEIFVPKPKNKFVKVVYKGIAQVNPMVWILDSGSSRHMIGDRALLSNVVEKVGHVVSFGDNSKGLTEGYGCLEVGNIIIDNVSIVQDSDDDKEPEIVVDNGNDIVDDDPSEGGGNISNNGDTTNTGGDSSNQQGNNSGGESTGSTIQTSHPNEFQDESSRTNLPRQTVWNRAYPFELIIGDPVASENETCYSE
ncbi:uncharacterized protein LOC141690552 [Apium graveolens]|uniref:uncharacterized protein LOC141690552 n=1 Tax=Apium graveolens TaxID=4045 RepID=UPI003D79552A